MKKVVSFIVSFILILSNITCVFAADTTINVVEHKDTYIKVKNIDAVVDVDLDNQYLKSLKGGSQESFSLPDFEWTRLENRYFYKKLSKKRRELYDKIYDIATKYFNGKLEAVKKNYGSKKKPEYYYVINKTIDNSDSKYTTKDIAIAFETFYYENPEFFFIYPEVLKSKNKRIVFTIYKKFSTKDGLKKGAIRVAKGLNEYIDEVNKYVTIDSQDEIAWYLARKLYKTIPYDDDGADMLFDKGIDKHYTQTIYSVLVLKTTVCAGYAKIYEALLNYFGIDAIVNLGPGHAWNQVKFDNKWYTVDLTCCLDCGDLYYLPTRTELKNYDRLLYYTTSVHKQSEFYKKNAPLLSNCEYRKTYLPVEKQPSIEIVDDTDNRVLTISSSDGATIKYSLNNGEYKEYKEPIILDKKKNYLISAVAKVNGKSMLSKESILYITNVSVEHEKKDI